MSFILDAIAKSERERQQQEIPGAQALALPPENTQSRRLLPYFVLGVLLLNAFVFTIWSRLDNPAGKMGVNEINLTEQTSNVVRVQPDSVQQVPKQTTIAVTENLPVAVDSISESMIGIDIEINDAAANKGSQSGDVIKAEPELVQSLPVASITGDDTDGWVRIEPNTLLKNASEGLDTNTGKLDRQSSEPKQVRVSRLYDLPEAVRGDLPTVKFSGHLYSSNPAGSVVFLDNQRPVMQGQQITKDLFLYEITPTGVVVEFRGYFIDVGVLQNWTLN